MKTYPLYFTYTIKEYKLYKHIKNLYVVKNKLPSWLGLYQLEGEVIVKK